VNSLFFKQSKMLMRQFMDAQLTLQKKKNQAMNQGVGLKHKEPLPAKDHTARKAVC